MISPSKPHPRLCDICEGIAEKPYAALWNAKINERITVCSRFCLDMYKGTISEILTDRAHLIRRKSV